MIAGKKEKEKRKRQKKFFLFNLFFILCWFIWFKRDIKKNWNFSRRKDDLNDLLLPYLSGCKNKRITQTMNLTASKMKLFMTLIDSLFGKQLIILQRTPFQMLQGP